MKKINEFDKVKIKSNNKIGDVIDIMNNNGEDIYVIETDEREKINDDLEIWKLYYLKFNEIELCD